MCYDDSNSNSETKQLSEFTTRKLDDYSAFKRSIVYYSYSFSLKNHRQKDGLLKVERPISTEETIVDSNE